MDPVSPQDFAGPLSVSPYELQLGLGLTEPWEVVFQGYFSSEDTREPEFPSSLTSELRFKTWQLQRVLLRV